MRPLVVAVIFALMPAAIAGAETSQTSQTSQTLQSSQSSASGVIHRPSAAASASQPSSAKPVAESAGTFRVILSLAAVLSLIVLVYGAGRRMLPRHVLGGGGTQAIRVLARTPLSPKHRIVLLQVGRRVLVVAEGHGAQPLNTLCEITDPDEAAALIGQIRGEQSTAAKSFASLFNSATERFRAASEPKSNAATHESDPLAATQRQLDDLTQRVRGLSRHFERA